MHIRWSGGINWDWDPCPKEWIPCQDWDWDHRPNIDVPVSVLGNPFPTVLRPRGSGIEQGVEGDPVGRAEGVPLGTVHPK